MTAVLNFTETTDGLVFDVGGGAVPVDRWATLDVEAQANVRAQIGTLLRLRDQGDAEECGTNQLLVEHRAVAGLTGREARGLALPPRFDFQLRLPSEKFTVAEPEFRYRYQVIDRGRPLRFEAPRGCLMRVDGRDRLLPLPIFELITRMEAFNRTPPKRMDDRLRAWGELSKRLPDEVEVDPYLRSIRVVVPESFTLRPFVNPGGEPDFDPELLVHRSDNEQQDKMLPDARDEDFRAQFRGRRRVKGQYAAGEGWYVCVSEPMKLALEVVHDLQRAPVEVRRAALLNPRGFLADRLSDRVDALTLEAIFDDRGLGDRVMGIGLWEPKVMPWIDRPTQEWLPPEAVGLRVDDESLEIPKEQLEELRDRVVAGIAAGAPSVLLGDHSVPATHETVAALDVLIERTSRSEATGSDSREQPPDDEAPGRVVLLVKDHVTEASFEPEHLTRAGDVAAPSLLRSSLYPHQQVALEWLIGHWKRGSSGALLADDMGLGKTIESLAFIAWVREQMLSGLHPLRPVLVVAPSGLLQNWRDEAETHLEPEALGRLLPAYGPELRSLRDSKLRELQVGAPVLDLGRLERSDWTLTTYETLRDYQHSFGRVHWSVIVFDETQKIKNPRTAMTDAAKAQRADFLLAMTGTPVENDLTDLWCIVDTVAPGRLGSLRTFNDAYRRDPETGAEALRVELQEPRDSALMLRRLKEDHLPNLPVCTVQRMTREMPSVQAGRYARIAAEAQDARGGSRGAVLKALQKLGSTSLHPWLGDPVGELVEDDEFAGASARVEVLIQLLDEVAARAEKALVFVDRRWMQDRLIPLLQQRYNLARPPLVINGSISGKKRTQRVNEFQDREGFDVMLLSPRAGGVGLTLTAANHVIHLSRWWNPAVEDQCTDRVFRIGQKRDVQVHIPLAVHPEFPDHSFDRRLDDLLERKRQLCRSALLPGSLNNADLDGLLGGLGDRSEAPGPGDDR